MLGAYPYVMTDPTGHRVESPEDWDFDELYRSRYARMVALARLMSARPAVAEEIVQDAYVQLYRNWSSVEHPITYLRIAVVNGCRSHGRRRTVERRHGMAAHEPVVIDTAAIAVRDALAVLTPRQRAAVVLRYFEDQSERDIADALGCRPGTVKSLLSRSITKLRRSLDD